MVETGDGYVKDSASPSCLAGSSRCTQLCPRAGSPGTPPDDLRCCTLTRLAVLPTGGQQNNQGSFIPEVRPVLHQNPSHSTLCSLYHRCSSSLSACANICYMGSA